MSVSADLRRLIDTAAPYWAGEAEVIETYWTWPGRTRETDRLWLAHQCFKEFLGFGPTGEFVGVFSSPLEQLRAAYPKIDVEIDRHEVLDIAEGLYAEFAHYCAFADAYDALAVPGEPKLDPRTLTGWAEDDALGRLRGGHVGRYGKLGRRAGHFTEGGYCTLFSAGMRLADKPTPGHARADALIATACARVYDDEFGHMLKGIVGLDEEGLAAADWRTLAEISVAQMKARIVMRQAQFGHPVGAARLEQLLAGACPPIAFDYARAKLAA